MRHFVAKAPSQGMRLIGAGHKARLHILDDNGCGYPWMAVILPVQVDGTVNVFVRGQLKPAAQASNSELWVASQRMKMRERDGMYVLHNPFAGLPGGCDLLVLLIYYESISTLNSQELLPRAASDQTWAETCNALKDALSSTMAPDLTSGLIRGLVPPNANGFTIAFASCLYPCDLLDQMPRGAEETRGPADLSLLRLADILDAKIDPGDGAEVPRLLVMCGDQVYVDATAGLFDPKVSDDRYRIPYLRLFASRGAEAVFARHHLEVRMVIDDHEIIDNWEPGDDLLAQAAENPMPGALGIEAYWKFQRLQPPLSIRWTAFSHGLFHVFLGDTRTERESRTAHSYHACKIMSDRQKRSLERWLSVPIPAGETRVVVTPSILLPRRLTVASASRPETALLCDSWVGYPESLEALLAFVCDNEIRDLVFLSGDEHLSCVAWIEITSSAGRRCRCISIHSSPLFAPYPFANSRVADFPLHDCFSFCRGPLQYVCKVAVEFAPLGSGFALLTRSDSGAFVHFHRPNLSGNPVRMQL